MPKRTKDDNELTNEKSRKAKKMNKKQESSDEYEEDKISNKKKKSKTHRPSGNRDIINTQVNIQIEELIVYLFNKLKDRGNDFIDQDSLHRNIINLDLTDINEENVQVG